MLIHYTPAGHCPPSCGTASYSNQSAYTNEAPPLYSPLPLYDHTHQLLPPTQYAFQLPGGPFLPRPQIKPHLQLSVNGYSHMYDTGPHPLTHYPSHPPPRYEEAAAATSEGLKYNMLPGQQHRPHPLQHNINEYSLAAPPPTTTSGLYNETVSNGEYF